MFHSLLYYKNPFVITMIVIFSTVILGITLITIIMSWFFYSVVVIFLGGIIVVFLYASSLSTLFKIETNFKIKWVDVILFPLSLRVIFINRNYNSNITPLFIYSSTNQWMIVYLVLFLLSVLFLVVKLSTRDTGPLKL
jgi:hypothetical protein